MTTRLPDGMVAYKRTPMFTEATVPNGLLSEHATKDGVWGLIYIEEGELRYHVTDARRPHSEAVLTPQTELGVIEPTIIHRVEPVTAVRFCVEFWKARAAG